MLRWRQWTTWTGVWWSCTENERTDFSSDVRKTSRTSLLSTCLVHFTVHLSLCSTVVLQCYRRQAVLMEQGKIGPSLTLYSLDRSLPNLVWLITSATPAQRPVLVKFGSVGNSPQIGEYNLFVTFCSVPFFIRTPRGKACKRICTCNGSKRVKSDKDVLLGNSSKNGHPHPH